MKMLKQFLLYGGYESVPEKWIRPYINSKIPEELKLALLKKSKEEKLSQKEIVVEALKKYLKGGEENESS